MRFTRHLVFASALALSLGASLLSADVSASSGTFDLTGSTSKGSDSTGSTSDSTKPDSDPKARKIVVPMRARDEAALWLLTDTVLPQSALLRSTIQAFRRVLESEGRCVKKCTDAEVLVLLLSRTEAVRGG